MLSLTGTVAAADGCMAAGKDSETADDALCRHRRRCDQGCSSRKNSPPLYLCSAAACKDTAAAVVAESSRGTRKEAGREGAVAAAASYHWGQSTSTSFVVAAAVAVAAGIVLTRSLEFLLTLIAIDCSQLGCSCRTGRARHLPLSV